MSKFSANAPLKRIAIMVHDGVAAVLALALMLNLRFTPDELALRTPTIIVFVPPFLIAAVVVFRFCRLYASKWRFASLPDLFNIFRASSILALILLAIDLAIVARGLSSFFIFGEKAVIIYWILQMFTLGGPRLAYRYYRYLHTRRAGERDQVPSVLVLGASTDAEIVLRALETHLSHRFVARGILSPNPNDEGMTVRGVRVLGAYADLERVIAELVETDQPVSRAILAPSRYGSNPDQERVVATARRLNIALYRMQTVGDALAEGSPAALAPIDVEDILFRPAVDADHQLLSQFLHGKRVFITGGGGSIGSELCLRCAAFGAAELFIVDSSEPALYAISEAFAARRATTRIRAIVSDIRDRARVFHLLEEIKPDLVFHAAALKHVPQLEDDWTEAFKTNVLGTINVADAAASVGSAMVLISTDKAVNPVSILGATKRLAEMYIQMRDAQAPADGKAPPFISVRFGNVLVSSGSVVPKFKAQIARGGPVTVTHPDMVRYFMTVREATDLVLTAAAHAVQRRQPGSDCASVYVLRMGQPARILDLAERLIRLAGFEPGRDIPIVFTGMRKGERMNESVFASDEPTVDIGLDGVMASQTPMVERARLTRWIADLSAAVGTNDRAAADRVLGEAFPSYRNRQPVLSAPGPGAVPALGEAKVIGLR